MNIDAYIREQPDALRAVFAQVPGRVRLLAGWLVSSPPSRLILIGSGTSRHALLAVQPGLARVLPCAVTVYGPLEFLRQPPQPDACVLVLSQSGSSMTSVESLRRARAAGMRSVAVTAEPDSALAQVADPPVILPIGPEPVGPKTKGYTASIAALLCLQWEAEAARDGSPDARAPGAARACGRLDDLMGRLIVEGEALARSHRTVRHVMVLGQGRHVATALEGSLKLVEMSGVPSCGFDAEEALHGRFQALRGDDLAIFVAANQDEVALARGAARALEGLGIPSRVLAAEAVLAATPVERRPGLHGEIRLSGPEEMPAECDLLTHIVPLQAFAYNLAILRGIDPNRMPYPGLSSRLGIKFGPSDGAR